MPGRCDPGCLSYIGRAAAGKWSLSNRLKFGPRIRIVLLNMTAIPGGWNFHFDLAVVGYIAAGKKTYFLTSVASVFIPFLRRSPSIQSHKPVYLASVGCVTSTSLAWSERFTMVAQVHIVRRIPRDPA